MLYQLNISKISSKIISSNPHKSSNLIKFILRLTTLAIFTSAYTNASAVICNSGNGPNPCSPAEIQVLQNPAFVWNVDKPIYPAQQSHPYTSLYNACSEFCALNSSEHPSLHGEGRWLYKECHLNVFSATGKGATTHCVTIYEDTVGYPSLAGGLGDDVLGWISGIYSTYTVSYNDNQQLGQCRNGNLVTKHPVNPATGNKFFSHTLKLDSNHNALEFKQYYNSRSQVTGTTGTNWQHNYSRNLEITLMPNSDIQSQSANTIFSSEYSTPDEACTAGWLDIKPSINKPWTASSIAIYAGNYNCNIMYDNGTKLGLTLHLHRNYAGGIPYHTDTTAVPMLIVTRPDGQRIIFHKDLGNNQWYNDSGHYESVVEIFDPTTNALSGYQYSTANDEIEDYDTQGKLLSITDTNGNTQILSYNSTTGLLESVANNTGESIDFIPDANGNIGTLLDHTGRLWQFAYDASNNLQSITNPDSTVRTYHYEDPAFPNALTGITDERNIRYSTYGYDTDGNANLTTLANNVERIDFVYNTDGTRTLTNSRNAVSTYTTNWAVPSLLT